MTQHRTDQPLYDVTDLVRAYTLGNTPVRAVDGVDLQVHAGELLAIEGTSGSGKSTLLAMLGGLDRPSSGSIKFDGVELSAMNDRQLTDLRAREIGFIFQGFNLIPTLNAVQNIEAVMAPLGLSSTAQRARALELLERVGLAARADHLPSLLSGGEQQRVAVARALANNPRVVLADEPTGNLDSNTASEVVALLRSLTDDLGVTIVLVTHDRELASQAPRRIAMRDGRVVGQPRKPVVVEVPEALAPVITLPAPVITLPAPVITLPAPVAAAAEAPVLVAAAEATETTETTERAAVLSILRPAWSASERATRLVGRAAASVAVIGIGAAIVQSGGASPVAALKDPAPLVTVTDSGSNVSDLPTKKPTTLVTQAKDATVITPPKTTVKVTPVKPVVNTAPTTSTVSKPTTTTSKPKPTKTTKPKPASTTKPAPTPTPDPADDDTTTTTTNTPGWPFTTGTSSASNNPLQAAWWWPWNWSVTGR